VFLVVARPGHSFTIPPHVRAERLEAPQLDISSTAIRRCLQAGERRADVPVGVLDYIAQQDLYRPILG